MSEFALAYGDILDAWARIDRAGSIHRTPVATCATLDKIAGRRLYLKCENLQKVGAFKARGATNAVGKLSAAAREFGVVTHSSGNHAQALALAAREAGVPAHIVMPTTAPAVKRAAVEGYGARVIPCAPTLEARESTAAQVVAETGATFVHPYDNADVIAGQGTASLELLDAVPGLDAVMTPVGGGGLLAGTALAMRGRTDGRVRVFAAEPTGADDTARSKAAGERLGHRAGNPNTICDGLLTTVGELTFPIIDRWVDAVFTVDDDAVIAAMKLVWERAKLIIEPSAAVPVAVALWDEAFKALDGIDSVGIVLSGGNVDLAGLPFAN